MRKASVENFIYHEGLKLSSFTLLNGHCFLLEIFPNSIRCHWILRGHMTSNNETVSCQNLRQHCKIYDVRETKGRIFRKVLQPRSQRSPSLLRERTRVAAGHVAPRIWKPKVREGKNSKQLSLLLLCQGPREDCRLLYYQLMALVFEKVNKTRKNSIALKYPIVLLRTRLAIHLVYRAPAEILTKADVIHVNLTIALSFPFHEPLVRSMQIYQKLVLHVQTQATQT